MIVFGVQLPVVVALSTSAIYLVALLLSLRQRGFSTWLQGVFTLYVLFSILWSVAHALVVWRGVILQVPQIGWEVAYSTILVLPILIVLLTILFFERPRAHWIALIGGLLVVLVALIDNNVLELQATLKRGLGIPSTEELLQTLRWSIWGSFGLSAVVLTIWGYVQTRRPLHRNRVLYWLIALLLIVGGEGLTLAPILEYRMVGLIVRVIGVSLMAFVLVSYYLPILRTIIRQSLSTILMILVTGGLYLLGFLMVRRGLETMEGTSLLIVIMLTALVLAIFTPTVREIARKLFDRFLFGGRYDPSRALRDYSTAISNILDLDMLSTVAIGIISEAMEATRGALLVLTEQEDGAFDVKVVPGMGDVKVKTAQFSPASPILDHLRAGQPLTQYEVDILPKFRSASLQVERAWLQTMDMELYVPIHQKSSFVGLIALGTRADGVPYSRQDLSVLNTLAGQTTVALQNARLVADLKALNAQMLRLNEELKDTNRRLEKLDAAKTDFIQIASHELRTPITQARGYADMLGDLMQSGITPGPAQVLKISQGVNRATRRLEEIVTAMLDVSQIDVQALNLNQAPVAVTTIVRMAMEPYRDGLAERDLTLTVEGLEGLPPLPGDLQRLCQAFGNIIVNCIKYTPDGGKITITGRAFPATETGIKGSFIEIVIADTGIGINPEDHELIFEKFYRVGSPSLHSTGATKFMGAGPGLGLPIARGIIQAHGGRVWVESEGRDEQRCPGSQFHILMPAFTLESEAATSP